MGHSGFGDWEASVGVGRDYPNAYLDLATVYVAHDFGNLPPGNPVGTSVSFMECLQLNGIIEFMVEKASSKKILYATDLPWYSPHYAAGAVLFARIDDEARHDILHSNAERLLSNVPTSGNYKEDKTK
jgi:predicted TIM-barrel fold metal-dependent hydrolase